MREHDRDEQLWCRACLESEYSQWPWCPGFEVAHWAKNAISAAMLTHAELYQGGESLFGEGVDADTLAKVILEGLRTGTSNPYLMDATLNEVARRTLAAVRSGPGAVTAALTAARLLGAA